MTMTDGMGRKDVPELEAAFKLLRTIYWREYGRGWRKTIETIRSVAADPGPAPDGERADAAKEK